jgi:hypothetical protein
MDAAIALSSALPCVLPPSIDKVLSTLNQEFIELVISRGARDAELGLLIAKDAGLIAVSIGEHPQQ